MTPPRPSAHSHGGEPAHHARRLAASRLDRPPGGRRAAQDEPRAARLADGLDAPWTAPPVSGREGRDAEVAQHDLAAAALRPLRRLVEPAHAGTGGGAGRRSSSRAATIPPTAPNRCPCHEIPGVGTRLRASVVP